MVVELLTRARAMLSPALLAAALCAAILPLSPVAAEMMATTAPPTPTTGANGPPAGAASAPPATGANAPPAGGRPTGGRSGGNGPMMPPMGGGMGMPGGFMPGNDDGPGDAGPGGAWSSDPVRMRRQIEDLNRTRQQRAMPAAGSAGTADDGEQYIPDEVVLALPRSTSGEDVATLLKRHNIYLVEQLDSELADIILVRARILDQRDVLAVTAAVAGDKGVSLAQPNFIARLQRAPAAAPPATASPPLQYALAKMRLPQAHGVARGDQVLVGMIDTAVDEDHPDLDGAIAAIFDATGGGAGASPHGTAIASLIAGRGRLTGAAPAARLLVARAFNSASAKGNSFTVLKSIDWLAGRGARIINMSFAGPADPAVHRMVDAAAARGIVLIAAAGNAGPHSPPLYPAAEPRVIAVTATDAGDRLYGAANRGSYIALAAPGVDLFVAAPDGGYAILSGTSFSAAEVSGIAALMLQRRPTLTPAALRAQLIASARPAGPGIRIADAFAALTAGAPAAKAKPRAR